MRRKSLFVRLVGVCLFAVLFSLNAPAQTGNVTEGSLRVIDAKGASLGLCPLKNTHVEAEISGFISRVNVTQTFENPFSEKIEAVYTFPLPNDAAVDDLTIQIGTRTIKGVIMERRKAQATYEAAKEQGKTAALLEQQRPNIFTQSVANIASGAEIKVVISYVETLKYADDTYEFRFPMTIGERYLPSSVEAADGARISPKSKTRPGHTVSLELKLETGVSIEDVSSNTHLIEASRFSPSRFEVKLQNADEIPNRDFVLRYKTAGVKIEDAVLAHKTARGGFFSLILQPPDRVFAADTMPKEIVFLLDTSGSMDGFPIKKAKEAMRLTLENVNPQDTFNLITFAGETRILFEQPVPATEENLSKAKKWLSDSEASGGTEMMQAIRAALAPSGSQNHVRIVCFMTDGQVGNEAEIIAEVQKNPQARVFAFGIGDSVNHYLLDEISREGRGEVEYVGLADNGSAAARRFYERIRNPLLTDISLEFEGVRAEEVYPRVIPDLFDAKPVAVVGRYAAGGSGKIIMRGKMRGQLFERAIAVDFPEQAAENEVLATIWARRKIADLMKRSYASALTDETRTAFQSAMTDLGLEFRILTPFTSFVAVDELSASDGTAPRRVEVPVAAPQNGEFIENYWARREPQTSGASYGLAPGIIGTNAPVNMTGGISEMVTVVANTNVTGESGDTKIDTNITVQQLGALPRGRSFQSLLSTATGVSQLADSPTLEKRGIVSSNGQRPTSNNFRVDGLSANLGISTDDASLARNAGALPALTASGGTNNLAMLGETQEITVKTMDSAKEQRVAGAEIGISSRGGTNAFHGSLFETFGNEKLNANDSFANARALSRPPARLNQFGGTLNGYIWKDKAWFSGGYEGLRLRQAGFAVSEVPGFDSRIASAGTLRSLLDAFPLPQSAFETSNGFSEFAAAYTNQAAHDIFGLRIDTQPIDVLRIGGRFNFADSKASLRGDRDFSLNTLRKTDAQTNSLSVWTTYTASPTVVIDGRVNFSRYRVGQQFTLDDFGGADTSSALFQTPFDFLKFDFAGKNAALAAGNPIRAKVSQFQASGAVDWIINRHQLSFGADFRRLSLDPGAAASERNVLFAGVSGSFNLMSARVTQLERDLTENAVLHNFSLFAQHDWRVTSRLRLNLGLRWDADFAPRTDAPRVAFQNAAPQMPDRLNNFAPRAGVAFDIFGDGRAVLRGGAGLYFDYGNAAASDAFANSFPFAAGAFARNTILTGAPIEPLRPLMLFAENLQTPRAWHIFAEYQQELFRNHVVTATFTSSKGRRLFLTRTFFDAVSGYNYARLTSNEAKSDFDALQIRFERRFSQGFSFNARYALSNSKDNFSPDALRETNFVSDDPALDRGSSDFDVRHQLSVYGVYEIPLFFSEGLARRLTEGWSIAAFANARTGFPVNVGYTRINDFGKEFVRADAVAGVPVFLHQTAVKLLNPQAFSLPGANRQGDLKRNGLRGFPLFQIDATLQRRIRLTSETRLELAISAYNLLNRTNFADMSGNLGTLFTNGNFLPNEYFGQSTSTFGSSNFTPFYLYGGARTLQLSAKFVF